MYRVEWVSAALAELAGIWTQADRPARQAITAAVELLDSKLRSNPFDESESRGDDMRVQFARPLAIDFMVDSERRVVWVSHVRRVYRRGDRKG